MRRLLSLEQHRQTGACVLPLSSGSYVDGPHLWALRPMGLFCQRCTLLVDFKNGVPDLTPSPTEGTAP